MENKIKVGDTILVEQAWEDEAGNYHDEYAKVLGLEFDNKVMMHRLKLDFYNASDQVKDFLKDAEFYAEDYQESIV